MKLFLYIFLIFSSRKEKLIYSPSSQAFIPSSYEGLTNDLTALLNLWHKNPHAKERSFKFWASIIGKAL